MRLSRRDVIFLLLAGVLVALYALSAGGGFPLDDSWIHQTYARNLALRGEWAFIPGEPSAASTSPLYTLLLSIGYALRLPYLFWTHLLGALTLWVGAVLAARLAEMAAPQTRFAGTAAGLAVLFTWHLIWAAASGMETMLFSTLTLLLIWLAWRETDERSSGRFALLLRGALFGLATALAALARPEGILLGGIAALMMLIHRPQGNLQRVLTYGVGAAVAFAITLYPYIWLNLQLTGGLLPNTAAAKFQQHIPLLGTPYPLRFLNLLLTILAGGQFLLVPGMIAYVVGIGRRADKPLFFALPLWWSLGLIALYAARLPATYQHGRYVIPALPALLLIGAVGTLWLIQWARRRRFGRIAAQALAVSAVVTTTAFIVIGMRQYQTDVAVINGEMVAAAMWIDENIPDDQLLAVHDIGAVGYFAPREILDIAGLISRDVTPFIGSPDDLWRLMQDRGARYLLAFPNQIPGQNPEDARLCPVYSTNAEITRRLGEPNMTIYRLDWDAECEG